MPRYPAVMRHRTRSILCPRPGTRPQEPIHLKHDPQNKPTRNPHHEDHPLHGKTVIGWSEYVQFPAWGIDDIQAKVDTGARTSALHVEDIESTPDGRVRFHVMVGRRPPFRRVLVTAPVVRYARVRSSSGHFTMRFFVRTQVRIGPVVKAIDISLVSREKMVYRMLLGRGALAKDFLVDVNRRRVLGGATGPTKKKKHPTER